MRLIDTDKLKFPNIKIFYMKLHGVTVSMVRLIDLQMLVPTVDAAPVKHGRWIHLDRREYATISGKCSCCGWEAHYYEDDVADMPYCPNCGARMDLEEDHIGQKTEIKSHLYNEDEAADNMRDYCERYEPTYNTEDGSM